MPHPRTNHARRPDPRGPLVFDIRALRPGSSRTEQRAAEAPSGLGAGMVRVPAGGSLELDLRLDGVAEGVLVTAEVTAALAGECARCLEPFTATTAVRFQELFAWAEDSAEADGYLLDGDLLDLEPALRDALVLELPLSPRCEPACPGLCPVCGVRLADAGPEHSHPEQAASRNGTGDASRPAPGGDNGSARSSAMVPDDRNGRLPVSD